VLVMAKVLLLVMAKVLLLSVMAEFLVQALYIIYQFLVLEYMSHKQYAQAV
jgi:hypothetical protein